MCTVVLRLTDGAPTQILALRDELIGREFDEPDAWWPEHPGVVGGRDRVAGGTWCATHVDTGVTALLLNRCEKRIADAGAPSRGVLPLTALRHSAGWPAHLDPAGMASYTLIHDRTVWDFDGTTLGRRELEAGTHMFTSGGAEDGRAATFGDSFAEAGFPAGFQDIVDAEEPDDRPDALLVRHAFEDKVFGTVFGQLIEAAPGRLWVRETRTPADPTSWSERVWP